MQTKLTQKLGQRLALTPQLTQSLKILAMNAMDLDTYIEECIESNPLLEQDESQPGMPREADNTAENDRTQETDWHEHGDNRWETMYTPSSDRDGVDMRDQQWQAQQTVGQSLHEQANRQPMKDVDRILAHALIDSLDDDGYFRLDPGELTTSLHCNAETLEKVLVDIVQQLEPVGIGARDLAECLLLQLDGQGACDALARRLLLHFPDQLLETDEVLACQMGCSIQELACTRARLRRLDPFPGHGLYGQDNIYVCPEVIFQRSIEGDISIEVPGYSWQGLHLNEQWKNQQWKGAERGFMDTATRNAKWLLYALEQRRETLHKVAHCLARRQKAFLEYGLLGLKPLTLQDVAGEVGLHESTVSRVTNGKYAETPLGLIEMRRFFSAGLPTRGGGAISVYRVQQRVRALIDSEPSGKPISDQAILNRLQAEGIEIARRTVAKYRKTLGLPPSSQRRRQDQHTRR